MYFSPAPGTDYTPKKVSKNCYPELSCIYANLIKINLKESGFPDCFKVSSVVPALKNVAGRYAAKNYRRARLLGIVGKIFEVLVNKRLAHHLRFFFLITTVASGHLVLLL